MLIVIDNYDSFTYNLVQYLGELGENILVFRNDKVTIERLKELSPRKLVISPGPCTPEKAGISKKVVHAFYKDIPILGVCLGHQCIAEVFGGKVVRAERLMHGKTSMIHHDGKTIFRNLGNPFIATRYHSLIVKNESLPPCLQVVATTEEGEIMALMHKDYPVWGVQFHPESILTAEGKKLLKNFLEV